MVYGAVLLYDVPVSAAGAQVTVQFWCVVLRGAQPRQQVQYQVWSVVLSAR